VLVDPRALGTLLNPQMLLAVTLTNELSPAVPLVKVKYLLADPAMLTLTPLTVLPY